MDYGDLLGIRYKPHGRTKEEGFDCYGLAIEVLKRNGITLPDLYYKSIKDSEKVYNELRATLDAERIDSYEENCILEITRFGEPSHIAVYIGDGLMIHTGPKIDVVIEPVRHYKNRIRGIWRVNN